MVKLLNCSSGIETAKIEAVIEEVGIRNQDAKQLFAVSYLGFHYKYSLKLKLRRRVY